MRKKKTEKKQSPKLENGVRIGEKFSLEHCKKILNKGEKQYTNSEVLEIRDFLYKLATIDYLAFTEETLLKLQINNEHEQNSNHLHQSEYGRAG